MTDEVGFRLAQRFLAERPRPTALLVASMMMALGAFRAMRAAGLELGRDVSMIAHDDVFPFLNADRMVPPMSTTRSSIRAAGARSPSSPWSSSPAGRPRRSMSCGRSTSSSADRQDRRRRNRLRRHSQPGTADASSFRRLVAVARFAPALAEDRRNRPKDPIDQALTNALPSRKDSRRGHGRMLRRRLRAWDKALNAAYGELMDLLDADQKALKASQRQWIAFRDADRPSFLAHA